MHTHTDTSYAAAVEGDTRVVSFINDSLAFDGCVYVVSQRAVGAVCREVAEVAKVTPGPTERLFLL